MSVCVCWCLWWRHTLSLADAVSHQPHLISSSVYVCAYLHMQIDIDVSVFMEQSGAHQVLCILVRAVSVCESVYIRVCVCVFT